MWRILEHKTAVRQIGRLPLPIRKQYQKWKDIIKISGPAGLKNIRGLWDESLKGEWNGYRSSRLNNQYRVIYRVEDMEVWVEVVRVSAHDYDRN